MLARGLWDVDVALASSSGVVGLVVLAWAESRFGDRNVVLAGSGLQAW